MPKEHLFWYSLEVGGIKIGDDHLTPKGKRTAQYHFSDYSLPAIYDTGTSLIYTPAGIGSEVISRIVMGHTY
jgi:hypothetical protein